MREDICDLILKERDKGNIVFLSIEGFMGANLEEFLEQPAEGVLYDLNRLGEVALTFIEEENGYKWVNDFAVSLVIEKLMEQRDKLRLENEQLKKEEE